MKIELNNIIKIKDGKIMHPDYTVEENVVELMESSKTRKDWNLNCDYVKWKNNGDYPDFWWNAIVVSGIREKFIEKINLRSCDVWI